jgi:hypothetical protein
VLPPKKTGVMVEAFRRNANAVGYFLFTGARHADEYLWTLAALG